MHFLNLTLGIRFEPVVGGLSRLKEMAPDTSMQMVRSNENNIVYPNSMKIDCNELIRRLLSGVTDDELDHLVRVREEVRRPIPTPRKRTPVPAPRKMGVKQLIRYFGSNPIPPYRPIPAPRMKKQLSQPIPAPRTKITKKSRALKGYTQSYEISIKMIKMPWNNYKIQD